MLYIAFQMTLVSSANQDMAYRMLCHSSSIASIVSTTEPAHIVWVSFAFRY